MKLSEWPRVYSVGLPIYLDSDRVKVQGLLELHFDRFLSDAWHVHDLQNKSGPHGNMSDS